MRQLYIPTLKTELVLAEDWVFMLHRESRNTPLIDKIAPEKKDLLYSEKWADFPKTVKLWQGTVLIVDRIYIKQNLPQYDSITFRIKESPQQYAKARFWAKLDDVNRMVIE